MSRSRVCLAAAAVIAASPAAAEDHPVRITVYNSNIALVNEARPLKLAPGRTRIEAQDVPALIDPTSVHLRPADPGVQLLEQNFQYDLASPDRILDRYLDQEVEALLKGGDLKAGRLLSFDGGSLVLQGAGGEISLVARAEVTDVRLPDLPAGLKTRPTLVWTLESKQGGVVPAELSYMTGGVNWHAEYVAIVNESDTAMDLSAWVSLENQSGGSFPEAQLQLVAGEVHRVQPPAPMFKGGREAVLMARAGDASQGFEEEPFFEYHLYTLSRPTTLADRETKQLALFPPASGPVKKVYEYRGQNDPKKVSVVLEAENREERGLGMPLPAGKVRTYKKDTQGRLQFAGEDQIDHTPRNEKIRLRLGNAFDVVGERNQLADRGISDRIRESDVEIKIRNRKTEPIEVLVIESLYGDWSLVRSSAEGNKKDARTLEFRLQVGADQEVVLTYTSRTRW